MAEKDAIQRKFEYGLVVLAGLSVFLGEAFDSGWAFIAACVFVLMLVGMAWEGIKDEMDTITDFAGKVFIVGFTGGVSYVCFTLGRSAAF